MNWLTQYKIPLGNGAKAVVDWLTANLAVVFDFIATVLSAIISAML
jgi:glycine betaine/proline transport system permease protein